MRTVEWTEPWQAVQGGCEARLEAELEREFPSGHPMRRADARALGRRSDCDDVLFELPGTPTRYAVVRLTWPGKRVRGPVPHVPAVQLFDTFPEFQRHMEHDALQRNAGVH